jgi:hypothetical protein
VRDLCTAEPAAKRPGAATNLSDTYAKALAAALPNNLSTSADVRLFLAQPLPAPVLVDESHAVLLADGVGRFPMQARPPEHAMPNLEALLAFAFDYQMSGGSEEVWASLADVLTGHVWRLLSALSGALSFVDDRNTADASGSTLTGLRPDYCVWVNGALVLKAEHKRTRAELAKALSELQSKMSTWNPLVMRGMPFLPCFAVGGDLIQFALLTPGPPVGSVRLEAVTDTLSMRVPADRLRVLAVSFNMFRILVWLRGRMPDVAVMPLFQPQLRSDGGSITVFDDHVVKRCAVLAPAAVYNCLASGAIPCAVRVLDVKPATAPHLFARLKLQPVALEAKPRDEAQLRRALACVLMALEALHAAGFVHRDVRWPNVLRADADGHAWLLCDFELADAIGKPLPGTWAISPDRVAPEVRALGTPYTASDDIWQVGRLLASADLGQLPPAAAEFAAALQAPRAERPTASAARAHPWLVAG